MKSLFGRKKGAQSATSTPQESESHKQAKSSAGQGKRGHRQKGKSKAPAQPWTVEDFPVDPKEGEVRFHDLGLRDELMHGIADLGFKYCSPIQGCHITPIPCRATMP